MGAERVYDVECLYPDRKVPIPLGDLEAATPICNACVAPAHLPPRRGLTAGLAGQSAFVQPAIKVDDGRERQRGGL